MGWLKIGLLLKPKVSHAVQFDLPTNMRKYNKISPLKKIVEIPYLLCQSINGNKSISLTTRSDKNPPKNTPKLPPPREQAKTQYEISKSG